MEDRVKISSLDTARLICPECRRAKIIQLSEYKLDKRYNRMKYLCRCGHTCMVTLENRVEMDTKTCLAGTYTATEDKGCKGGMVIKRLNSIGVTLKTNKDHNIRPGNGLSVEFILDDPKQSMVKKEVKVMAKQGRYLTAEFVSKNHADDLGHYLFFNKLYV